MALYPPSLSPSPSILFTLPRTAQVYILLSFSISIQHTVQYPAASPCNSFILSLLSFSCLSLIFAFITSFPLALNPPNCVKPTPLLNQHKYKDTKVMDRACPPTTEDTPKLFKFAEWNIPWQAASRTCTCEIWEYSKAAPFQAHGFELRPTLTGD